MRLGAFQGLKGVSFTVLGLLRVVVVSQSGSEVGWGGREGLVSGEEG